MRTSVARGSQLGMSLVELLVSVVVAVSFGAAVFATIRFAQDYSITVTQFVNHEEMQYAIRATASNPLAIAMTRTKSPRFDQCFQSGPAVDPALACVSGETYGLSLYDNAGELVAGPGDGPVIQPMYYTLSGARCPDETAPTVECPVGVTATFQAQGFPSSNEIPWSEPPAGKHHELVSIDYQIVVTPFNNRIPAADVGGSVIIDLSDLGLSP